METQTVTRFIFGKCKICGNDAVYSGMVCEECHEKKFKVVRGLYDKGLEPGTGPFIDALKAAGVYY